MFFCKGVLPIVFFRVLLVHVLLLGVLPLVNIPSVSTLPLVVHSLKFLLPDVKARTTLDEYSSVGE